MGPGEGTHLGEDLDEALPGRAQAASTLQMPRGAQGLIPDQQMERLRAAVTWQSVCSRDKCGRRGQSEFPTDGRLSKGTGSNQINSCFNLPPYRHGLTPNQATSSLAHDVWIHSGVAAGGPRPPLAGPWAAPAPCSVAAERPNLTATYSSADSEEAAAPSPAPEHTRRHVHADREAPCWAVTALTRSPLTARLRL